MLNKDKSEKKLSKLQTDVIKNCGTEPPFNNEYWDNKKEGIYVDVINGEPLFCSIHKFDSGTGWPSFYDVIDHNNITKHNDFKLGYQRTEVKSTKSNSHLGHVFDDGPNNKPRYCINSASLKFIAKEDLHKEGYEHLGHLFNKDNK